MRYLRLHAASWLALVVVSLLLFVVNGGLRFLSSEWSFGELESWWWFEIIGFPLLSGQGFFALLVDVCFAVFLLCGVIATIEFRVRSIGLPNISLLSLFGAISAICFYCFVHNEGVRIINWWLYELRDISTYAIVILFGVAVVGWGKLIGLNLKRK